MTMFWQVLKLSADNIRGNKIRSSLTVLGVVIGVMSVILIANIISGLNSVVSRNIQSLGSNIVTVSRLPTFSNQRLTEEQRQRKELTLTDAGVLRHEAANVDMVTSILILDFARFPNPNVHYGNVHAANVKILGVEPDYINVYVSNVHAGRFISESDVSHHTNAVVVGATVADTMFPNQNPVGKSIYFENDVFDVVGVLDPRGSMFGFDRDNFIWIPVTTMLKLHPESKYDIQIAMRATTQQDMPRVIDQVTEIMRRQRRVGYNQANSFEVGSQNQFMDFYQQLTGGIYLVALVIASIALMVGGIGVMNIMLVSVTERTREIGVRKAIGARRRDILIQFLLEAMVLTGAGGVIGILMGGGLSMLINLLSPLPSRISIPWVIAAFSVSVSVGLFFGIYPAARAARLDPIDALRYE